MTSKGVTFERDEWALVVWWLMATTIGWVVGFFICEALNDFLESLSTASDGIVIGIGVGVAQGLVARRRFAPARWWILASVIGFGVGKFVGDGIAQAVPGAAGAALSGAAIGASLGLAQWLILRRRVRGAAWWVPANAVAWSAGWSIISAVEHAAAPMATIYLIGAAGAALAGLVTGVALVWLLRHRQSGAVAPGG